MNIKTLKTYQKKAKDKLVKYSCDSLSNNKGETIILKSPTGSGKTFIMSEYIKSMCDEDIDICFVWASIGTGQVHEQSYKSLKENFKEELPIYLLDKAFMNNYKYLHKNSVAVVNWEKLNNKNSTGDWINDLMKDSEGINFTEFIDNTKNNDIKIILIIDESHTHASSDRAIKIRNEVINPHLTIEVSATPILKNYIHLVPVDPDDVIKEGMIQKELRINLDLDKFENEKISSMELVLREALAKRNELQQIYHNNNIDIIVLLLIQLPNNNKDGHMVQNYVENYLLKQNITKDNGKLAVWLTEEYINLDTVTIKNNPTEVLLFKQAIATGWDCPRAQILARFREIKSLTFGIQTVGRIIRTAEGKHYADDRLNVSYVYTDSKDFDIEKEIQKFKIIRDVRVTRNDSIYSNIKLKSYHKNRFNTNRINSKTYNKILHEVFCEELGTTEEEVSKKINTNNLDIKDSLLINKTIYTSMFDQLPGLNKGLIENKTQIYLADEDVEKEFRNLIKNNLIYTDLSSLTTIQTAIFNWFAFYFSINPIKNGAIDTQRLVCKNYKTFAKLIQKTIEEYKEEKSRDIKHEQENLKKIDNNWEVPKEHWEYSGNNKYVMYPYTMCLYKPCYLKLNKLEEAFVEYLEVRSDLIKWWWKNGDIHIPANFGIELNKNSTFLPDFIVQFINGIIGIFETKACGRAEDDNRLKSEALQQYIRDENAQAKTIRLIGGIVISTKENTLMINNKNTYTPFENSNNDWQHFDNYLSFNII